MEAAGGNPFIPFVIRLEQPPLLGLFRFFLTILFYEYRGFSFDIDIEMVPLNNPNIRRVYIKWRSPTDLGLFNLIANSSNEFVWFSIIVERLM